MFQKKSWLFLALVFALMALAFFLPFERITAQVGDAAVASSFNGWELVTGSGLAALVEGSAPAKRLTD